MLDQALTQEEKNRLYDAIGYQEDAEEGTLEYPKRSGLGFIKQRDIFIFVSLLYKKIPVRRGFFFVSSNKSTRKKNIFLFVLFCNSNPWKLSNKDILLDKKTFKLLYAQKLYFCILCICIIKSLKGFCTF